MQETLISSEARFRVRIKKPSLQSSPRLSPLLQHPTVLAHAGALLERPDVLSTTILREGTAPFNGLSPQLLHGDGTKVCASGLSTCAGAHAHAHAHTRSHAALLPSHTHNQCKVTHPPRRG